MILTSIGKLRFYYLYELRDLKTSSEIVLGFHLTLTKAGKDLMENPLKLILPSS